MDSREWEKIRAAAVKLEAIRSRDPVSFRWLQDLVERLSEEEALGEEQPAGAEAGNSPNSCQPY